MLHLFTGNMLTHCLSVVVLGFSSPDDQIREEHFHYLRDDPWHNFVVCGEEGLLEYLVQHFTPPAGLVLDLTMLKGMYSIVFVNLMCNIQRRRKVPTIGGGGGPR